MVTMPWANPKHDVLKDIQRAMAELRREQDRLKVAANQIIHHPAVARDLAAMPPRPPEKSPIPNEAIKQYDHVPDELLDRMVRTITQVKVNIEKEEELPWCMQATNNVLGELTKVNYGYHSPKVNGMGPNSDECYPFLSWEDLSPYERGGVLVNCFNLGLPPHMITKWAAEPSWLEAKVAVTSLLLTSIKLARSLMTKDEKGLEILRQEKKAGAYPYKSVPTGMLMRAQEANMGGRSYGAVHTAGVTMLAGTMVATGRQGFMMPCPPGSMAYGFLVEDATKGGKCRVATI